MTIKQFITANLRLLPAPAVPEIRLYCAHPGSGLSGFVGEDGPPPYWAYGWAGGTVLARYILDHPAAARGRRVLDLGCGSGLVAIAAAKAGASRVIATDIDPNALAAARLNAEANGVAIEVMDTPTITDVDVILAGDVFYNADVAERSMAFFDTCEGIDILVGDPGRAFLPLDRLERIAEYVVPDFGSAEPAEAWVYQFGQGEGHRPLDPKQEGVDRRHMNTYRKSRADKSARLFR